MRTTKPTRRRLPPAEREREIVRGAISFFAQVGFEGGTRELAERLGVTQPLLYRVFPEQGGAARPGLPGGLSQPLESAVGGPSSRPFGPARATPHRFLYGIRHGHPDL